MADTQLVNRLEILAARIRISILEQISAAGKGHVGGSMSAADAVAALYGHAMAVDPSNPHWEGRDRLVMSKGHSGCVVYAALMLKGFFPAEWAVTLNQLGTRLPSHCDRTKTPGIDMSTGSLGQGLSAASGIAHACALKGSDCRVYCILGDGECQEGQVWEAMMFAGYHRQGNLIALVDLNGKQVDGPLAGILPIDGIGEHARLFGWHVQEIDGNDMAQVVDALDAARAETERPSMIVMHTVKGRGCFAEKLDFNHGIKVTREQYLQDRAILEARIRELEGKARWTPCIS